jgi:ketosteroid isomerase-like protein
MNAQLSECINNYFEASNTIDVVRFKDCFTADAVVFDEGSTYLGPVAIGSWFEETRLKYEFSVTPITSTQEDDYVTVVAQVSGNFPGSPIQLRYAFELKGSKIQSLKIH